MARKTFQFATTSSDVRESFRNRRIASLIGVEGGHQLENSLAVLRQYYTMGVRYMTLTHSCHNGASRLPFTPCLLHTYAPSAFADSSGIYEPIPSHHNGLSSFGETLIQEMNRLGILVDLSHTSDQTALQALTLSRAPVIWSHSSARSVWGVPRRVRVHLTLNLLTFGDTAQECPR